MVLEGHSKAAFVCGQGEESLLPDAVAGTSALVKNNQGSMCVEIAARRLVMIGISHHVAMLCRPRKTAFQKHNHYKWLHEQKRLWPSVEDRGDRHRKESAATGFSRPP